MKSNVSYEMTSQPERIQIAKPSSLISRIGQLWQAVLNHWLKGYEPQVEQLCDRSGHTWWRAYDPISGRSIVSGTEQEILAWLEQLHNQ